MMTFLSSAPGQEAFPPVRCSSSWSSSSSPGGITTSRRARNHSFRIESGRRPTCHCAAWHERRTGKDHLKPYTPFQQIVIEHARRYPWWVATDLYKLIYQAAMGSMHAVPEREEARSRLEQEIASLGEGPAEPLLDPIARAV